MCFKIYRTFSRFYYYSSIFLKIVIWRESGVLYPGLAGFWGFLSANLTGNRQHLLATLDMGTIHTQHGLHVTSSVNRLRPVEQCQCERWCHSEMERRANKFCNKFVKTATVTREVLVQVYGRKAVSRKYVYAFAKGRQRLRMMSHVRVGHRQVEPQK